jgi:glycosyltransferase involved in cell wall biosynthesis
LSSPQKILYVLNGVPFFLSHRLPLALAAQKEGFDIHVAAPAHESSARIGGYGFHFHPITMSRKGIHPLQELSTLRELTKLYRSVRPTLVHHLTIKPILYGGIAARRARVPAVVSAVTGMGYVFSATGMKAALLRGVVTRAYRKVLCHPRSKVIFQNPDDQRAFIDGRMIDASAAVLIKGSGVDTAEYSPQPEPNGRPLVIFAGRMIWDKGVGEFVQAAQKLRSAGVNARFALIGESDPGYPGTVPNEQLTKWRDENVCEWWGQRKDMPHVFAESNIVCFPSYYREGVPKVLIEAASCGRAIVSTDMPGCREIARHEYNALLVPPRNVDLLADALSRLLNDRGLREQLGRRGREMVMNEFSVEMIIAQTMAVYRELISPQTTPAAV